MPQLFPAVMDTTRHKTVNYEEDEFWLLMEISILRQREYIGNERIKQAKRKK